MTTHQTKLSYKAQYTNPITLNIGDIVMLGEEEKEEKWKGWIWAETKTNKGWIPTQIINFSDDRKIGIITDAYTAKELDVEKGDLIIKIKTLNGWTWARKTETEEEGWIPNEVY